MAINHTKYCDLDSIQESTELFRENLRYLTEKSGLSIKKITDDTHVTGFRYYVGYADDDILPSLRTVFILASYFHVSPGDLISKDLSRS